MGRTDGMREEFIETGCGPPHVRYTGSKYDAGKSTADAINAIDRDVAMAVSAGLLPQMEWRFTTWPSDSHEDVVKLSIEAVAEDIRNHYDDTPVCMVDGSPVPALFTARLNEIRLEIDAIARPYQCLEHHHESDTWENMNFIFVVMPGDVLSQQARDFGS